MTTVAYRDGVLASDTRATSDGVVITDNHVKLTKVGGVLAAATGTSCMCSDFRAWVAGGLKGDQPVNPHPKNDDWSYWGLIVTREGAWVFQEPGIVRVSGDYYAMGTGRDFAMAAMEMGATAEEAVRIAIRFDVHSGGRVMSVSL